MTRPRPICDLMPADALRELVQYDPLEGTFRATASLKQQRQERTKNEKHLPSIPAAPRLLGAGRLANGSDEGRGGPLDGVRAVAGA